MTIKDNDRYLVALVDYVTKRKGTYCFIILYFLGFLIVTLLAEKTLHPGTTPYRIFAGIFLGTYAMAGRTAARYVWLKYRYKQRLAADAGLLCVFFVVLGICTWYAGWEGQRTGLPFGIGVFVSIYCYQLSIGEFYEQLFAKEIIPSCPTKEAPIDKK